MLPKPIIKSNIVDQGDTQPVELEAVPAPDPTPPRSNSACGDGDARRAKYQGKTHGMEATETLTPTTASTPSEPCEEQRLLELAEAELNQSKVLGRQKSSMEFSKPPIKAKFPSDECIRILI